jgi:hypothetical protein
MVDPPKTLKGFRLRCSLALRWLDSEAVKNADWRPAAGGINSYSAVRLEAQKQLRELHKDAIRLWSGEPDVQEPPEMPDVNKLDWVRAVAYVKRLRQWVIPQDRKQQAANAERLPDSPNGLSKLPNGSAPVTDGEPAGIPPTKEQVAERLERLRSQGEPYTSQRELAKQVHSSPATVNHAIQHTLSLRAWAASGKRRIAAQPRAQSLNDVVTDRAAQGREPDPVDEAAIREFLESADPETEGWFLALSRQDQLDYLHDPDEHRRILGRKP